MRAGFQVDVKGATASAFTSLFQREHFGVLHALIDVRPLATFLPGRIDHDRPNRRIRRRQADAAAGQIERPTHVMEFIAQLALLPRVVFEFGDCSAAAAARWTANRSHPVRERIFGLRPRAEQMSQPIEQPSQIRRRFWFLLHIS
jgi:hypothetical protein